MDSINGNNKISETTVHRSHYEKWKLAAFEAISNLELKKLRSSLSIVDVTEAVLPRRTPSTDDFDPRNHREPGRKITPWMAYFNLLRIGFGAGMLGMPLAISQSGTILGPILMLALGILLIHTHITLLWCLNEVSRQLKIRYVSYRYGFRLALLRGPPIFHRLGESGPIVIAVFMMLSQLGICSVFVIFTTDSVRDIMDWSSNKPAILTLLVPYLVLQVLTKSLKAVSYVSLVGNILNLIGLILVFVLIVLKPSVDVRSFKIGAIPLLLSIGTILFNLSAVGVILSLDKALEKPHIMTEPLWKCVISVGIFVPTVVSIVFGSLGYHSFGTMDENILRSLPFDNNVSMVAIAMYLVAVAFAYPIQCFPAIQIMNDVLKKADPHHTPSEECLHTFEYIIRPIFVGLTFLICYFFPVQGPFVAFVGNLCTSILSLVFPALMEICLLYPHDYGKYNVYLFKDLLVVIFGLSCFLFGVVLCGSLIYVRVTLNVEDTDYL